MSTLSDGVSERFKEVRRVSGTNGEWAFHMILGNSHIQCGSDQPCEIAPLIAEDGILSLLLAHCDWATWTGMRPLPGIHR